MSVVETPPPGDSASGNADMVHAVTKIERAIKERRDTDTTLINWWLYVLLVSWVTFGIYGIFLFFKRIGRIDGFSGRKSRYYSALIDWTEKYAELHGKRDDVHDMLGDMRSETQVAYKGQLRNINAGLSFVLTIVTLGFYGLYVWYRINRYWWDAMVVEQEFDDKLSQTWSKLGLTRYPISFQLDQSKRRSYGLYLVLTILTLGIWGLVWDYKIQIDPDSLYAEFHSIEDTVLQTIRAK